MMSSNLGLSFRETLPLSVGILHKIASPGPIRGSHNQNLETLSFILADLTKAQCSANFLH